MPNVLQQAMDFSCMTHVCANICNGDSVGRWRGFKTVRTKIYQNNNQ